MISADTKVVAGAGSNALVGLRGGRHGTSAISLGVGVGTRSGSAGIISPVRAGAPIIIVAIIDATAGG